MTNWEEIRKEWETSNASFKELAEKHGIKDSTIRSRKNREKWQRNDATQRKKSVATQKRDKSPPKKEVKEPVIESDELTDKQRLFCLYYLKYFNATKAYQKAYECSYAVANVEGYRNLVKPSIKKEIDRIKQERVAELNLDAQAVLQKYIDIAFADITDFVEFGQEKRTELDHNLEPMIDENGDEITYSYSYVNLKNHNEVDGTIITEVKKGKDGVSVKLADKMKALEFLAKYTEILPEHVNRKLQQEKIKHDMMMKEKEMDLKQQEIAKKNAPPEKPNIDSYIEALKGRASEVWAEDEE